jgi:predicted alpha/beta-fold hydrolase
LGNDVDIYGVGFSLGANHLLRYIGGNPDNCGIKAAISVSNPFDCMATVIRLRYSMFGVYDRAIKQMLARPFIA